MNNDQKPKEVKEYDLEERTAQFGEDVVGLCKKVRETTITRPLINQLVKCGTAVGAHYAEADDAESKKDFRHKIGLCKKESRESKHFLRMMKVAIPKLEKEIQILWQEAKELNLIFNSIYGKLR